MKKYFFAALAMIFLFSSTSFATTPPPPVMFPVQSVTVSYDLDKSMLHIEAAHPSNNWEVDYVRMMTVSINGQLISTSNYYHQTNARGFIEDVKIQANVGDVITVDVFSTQGNSISQDLTVTKPGE